MKLNRLSIAYVMIDCFFILMVLFKMLTAPPLPNRMLLPLVLVSMTFAATTNLFLLKGKRWAQLFALGLNLISFPISVNIFITKNTSIFLFFLQLIRFLLIMAIQKRSIFLPKHTEKDSQAGFSAS
jgi:hypothetical protein